MGPEDLQEHRAHQSNRRAVDVLGCVCVVGGCAGVLLASGDWSPGLLLHVLQGTGQAPGQMSRPPVSTASKVTNVLGFLD